MKKLKKLAAMLVMVMMVAVLTMGRTQNPSAATKQEIVSDEPNQDVVLLDAAVETVKTDAVVTADPSDNVDYAYPKTPNLYGQGKDMADNQDDKKDDVDPSPTEEEPANDCPGVDDNSKYKNTITIKIIDTENNPATAEVSVDGASYNVDEVITFVNWGSPVIECPTAVDKFATSSIAMNGDVYEVESCYIFVIKADKETSTKENTTEQVTTEATTEKTTEATTEEKTDVIADDVVDQPVESETSEIETDTEKVDDENVEASTPQYTITINVCDENHKPVKAEVVVNGEIVVVDGSMTLVDLSEAPMIFCPSAGESYAASCITSDGNEIGMSFTFIMKEKKIIVEEPLLEE